MTKVILVNGEGDCGVIEFEESGISVEKAYQMAIDEGGRTYIALEDETITVKAYDFGDVDSEFISFIRNEVQDYDMSKYKNFFIVEEAVI